MSAPLNIAELERAARERPGTATVEPGRYSDLLARMPRMSGQVLEWFREALQDGEKKWVVAALLQGHPQSARPLLDDLLNAALHERNPSFSRAFVVPLTSHLSTADAIGRSLQLAGTSDALLAGVARAAYWIFAELGDDPDARRHLSARCMKAFLDSSDPHNERSLLSAITVADARRSPETAELVNRVLAKARSHPDSRIRDLLALR